MTGWIAPVHRVAFGTGCAILVAIAAKLLANHYGAPAMLMALLLGIAVGFLNENAQIRPGIDFAAKHVLRIGVAFLGARISVDLIANLGASLIVLVIIALLATIGFGLLIGRLFGQDHRFSLLTAGSVAICGASAAMAISAVLPQDKKSEERLIFTVVGVTLLSTIAMILYPLIVQNFAMNTREAGVFLGGTIHDVAQVVGAGFSISTETGETATLVKLIRVAMLAPVVLITSIALQNARDSGGKRPPLVPGFVIAFLFFATINSLGCVPEAVAQFLGLLSRWMLLVAIAAVGMKTQLGQIVTVGPTAIMLIVVETLFIGAFVLIGLALMG